MDKSNKASGNGNGNIVFSRDSDISSVRSELRSDALKERGSENEGKPPQGASWIASLHPQALFINFDREDEQVYRAYFRRQRLGVLPVLVALATLHAILCVVLDLLPYYRPELINRLLVIGVAAAVVIFIYVVVYFIKPKNQITEILAVLMWLLITFQIFYDVGTTYPRHMPSDRIGWLLVHIFVTQMTVPVESRVSATLVVLLIVVHSVLVGVMFSQEHSSTEELILQLVANILLCVATGCIGAAGSLFQDRLNRRTVMETKSALIAKAKIEMAYKDKERLLLSVLPKHVADEMLKDLGSVEDGQFRKIYMQRYENVSILFADIVGFTAISSTVTASELVKILNKLFASFDILANKFHQVRIKILGDCYYCVCGALEPRMDHAVLSIHMGLSMVTAISSVRQSTGKDVNMRVGVHTGACLGGVLGQRQWQFDILGKEVTMANKMESGGLPGRVHISEATKQCLNGEFELEDGHGGDREEELKLKNITSYLVKSVIKPYPEGTLDKVTQSSPTKMISNGNKKNQVTDKKESSVEEDTTDSGHTISKEEEYRKELSLRLQHELLAKEKDSVLSGTLQPLTLTFKEKQLETRYHQRSDSYNGLPLMALSVALVVILGAKLCILPRSGLLIAIYLSGDIILFAMSAVSLSLTFRHYFPRSIIQFALTIDRHGTFKMLWGISACVIFFICDTLPSIDCHQVALNITMVTQCDMEALTCHHIVYFTHAASLVLIAISSMVNLGHMTKALLIYIATGIHCALVLLYVDVSYELYNEKIYQECSQSILVYPHIKYRLLGQMIAAAIDLNFFNFQMEFTSRKLFLWKEESKREKEKAADMQRKNEALVYNLLPAHVAKDFLGKKKNDLDLYSFSYDEVGVIFAACPNFHSFYNESSINNNGLECLRFLNEIISDYDELLNLARFSSIVKIKTVGPTYMAASGMVSQDDRKHVTSVKERWYHLHNLVQFAYALQDVLKKINEQSFNNFILRIGINHGPIIAGVIGARKPHYDIWGNTVNVASRMESTGQPGKIQVAEETKLLLENFGYKFETRGLVKVKGKGELMTYFLERPEGTNECDLNIPNSVPDG